MRKSLAIFTLLFCSLNIWAAITTHYVPGATPYNVVFLNRSWQSADWLGGGNTSEWVLDTSTGASAYCLYITNNNTTQARTFTLNNNQTGDLYNTTGFGLSWFTQVGNVTYTVQPSNGVAISIPSAGSAHFGFSFTNVIAAGGGSPDTVTVKIVQGGGCVSSINVGQRNNGANGSTTVGPNQWSVFNVSALAGAATAAQAATANVAHTAVCISGALASSAAPAQTVVSVRVWDGASGTTQIWSTVLSLPAVAGQSINFGLCGLQLKGTTGNAMTIDMPAGIAGVVESVSMSGYDQ